MNINNKRNNKPQIHETKQNKTNQIAVLLITMITIIYNNKLYVKRN